MGSAKNDLLQLPQAKVDGATGPALWPTLAEWLRLNGAVLDGVEVRTEGAPANLGTFSRRAIAAGDVAFSLPTKLLLSKERAEQDEVVALIVARLQKAGETIPADLVICLRLCRARVRKQDPFHIYAASLPAEAPQPTSWPPAFKQFLATTSLCRLLKVADTELDNWESLLKRAASSEPSFLAGGTFERSRLEWARGMLRSRGHEHQGTSPGELCMCPLLDMLNRKLGSPAAVEVRDNALAFVPGEAIASGQQLLNKFGNRGNEDLLMRYGVAVSDNRLDSVSMSDLGDGKLYKSRADGSEVRMTLQGIPQEVIDEIEESQDTDQFVNLLRAVLVRKRLVTESLAQLPKVLNFNVCKGPVARERKRSLEAFLEGQAQVMKACMDSMSKAEDEEVDEKDDAAGKDGDVDEREGEEEELLPNVAMREREEEEEEEVLPKRKKRRR